MSALLEVEGLARAFGGVRAVDGLSLRVERGEIVALIGPNGAGKSTAFDLISGQRRRDAGRVTLDGRALAGRGAREAWAAGIARSFQVAGVFVSMTAAECVQMALIAAAGESFRLRPLARRLHQAEALDLLASVGLDGAGDTPAAVLAHGDVKRLELAMALAGRPRLLMMDEPTAGMAPDARAGLMATVAAQVAERGLAVLFTEHDMDIVFGTADRVLVLDRGRLIAEGTPEAVRADARVRAVYLGTSEEETG